jgi:signal transduction histidine kinase
MAAEIKIRMVKQVTFPCFRFEYAQEKRRAEALMIVQRRACESVLKESVMETNPSLHGIRHDIRSRMTCIYSAVEVLEKMDLSDEQRWCVEAVKLEAEALMALVEEISNLSKNSSRDGATRTERRNPRL